MKSKVMMLLFVLIMGTILTTALVLVDSLTAPMIARNEEMQRKSSVLLALDIAYAEDSIEDIFAASVREIETAGRVLYAAADGQIAFQFSGSGLWGPIVGTLAIHSDLERISGVSIIRQEETPGLGSRIAESEHLSKFTDVRFIPELRSVPPGKGTSVSDIDAISGATLSSDAFVDILNRNLTEYLPLMEGVSP